LAIFLALILDSILLPPALAGFLGEFWNSPFWVDYDNCGGLYPIALLPSAVVPFFLRGVELGSSSFEFELLWL